MAGLLVASGATVAASAFGASARARAQMRRGSPEGSAPLLSLAPPGQPGYDTQAPTTISAAKLLGQRIMVGLPGPRARPALLRRIREGEVGAVVLYAYNIVDRGQVRALTHALQRAAREGGNPPLLIAVDQEGGEVKRFPAGPPFLAPPEIAASESTALAFREGRATGRFLKARGINMDFAPVVDAPTFEGSFIWREGRGFSSSPSEWSASTVARYATAFALGLQSAHVAATAQDFPGVGSAAVDTDEQLDEIRASRLQRRQALRPYRALIPRGLDAIMIATAGFPPYDPSGTPAALSRPIIQGLLRTRLKFGGVAITDAIGSPIGRNELRGGVLAAEAGADILLYTDSAPGVLGALESAMERGRITQSQAGASYERIAALKRQVASRVGVTPEREPAQPSPASPSPSSRASLLNPGGPGRGHAGAL
jgi:beta-N-acetylhexosaminidase